MSTKVSRYAEETCANVNIHTQVTRTHARTHTRTHAHTHAHTTLAHTDTHTDTLHTHTTHTLHTHYTHTLHSHTTLTQTTHRLLAHYTHTTHTHTHTHTHIHTHTPCLESCYPSYKGKDQLSGIGVYLQSWIQFTERIQESFGTISLHLRNRRQQTAAHSDF